MKHFLVRFFAKVQHNQYLELSYIALFFQKLINDGIRNKPKRNVPFCCMHCLLHTTEKLIFVLRHKGPKYFHSFQ